MTRFTERDTFEVSGDPILDAGEDRIGVAAADELVVVNDGGYHDVCFEKTIDDVAIDQNVYLLQNETVKAVTQAGIELWSRTVEQSNEIAATHGNVAVLTSDDRVIALDGNTGSTRFEHELDRTDLTTDGIYATKSGFLTAKWSFLTYIDMSGEVVYDVNVDAQIVSVGSLGDRAVAALKNDTVCCLDDDGSTEWSHDLPAKYLSASVADPLLVVENQSLKKITREGATTRLELPTGANVVATNGIELVGIVDEANEVTLFQQVSGTPDPEKIVTSLETNRVTSGGSLAMMVEYSGDEPAMTTLRLSSPDAELATGQFDVTLVPGEKTQLETHLTAIEGTTELQAEVDDVVVGSHELEGEQSPSARAIEVESAVESVVDGVANLSLEVTNSTAYPVDGLKTNPGDVKLDMIPEATTKGVNMTTRADWGETMTVEIVDENDVVVAETTLDFPHQPLEVSLTFGQGQDTPFGSVQIENCTEFAITESFELRLKSKGKLTHEATINPQGTDRLVVYFPLPAGQAAIQFLGPTLDIERTVSYDGSSTSSGSSEQVGETTGEPTSSESPITVQRRAPETAEIGRTFTEEISIKNTSKLSYKCSLEIADDTEQFRLGSQTSTVARRRHVAFESGSVELPTGDLRHGNGINRIEEQTVVIEESSIQVVPEIVPTPSGASVSVTCTNETASDIVVDRVSLLDPSSEELLSEVGLDGGDRIQAGETVELTEGDRIDQPTSFEDPPLVRIGRKDGAAIDSLARIRSVDEVPISVVVSSVTAIEKEFDKLTVRITNEREDSIGRLDVEATGEPVHDFYSKEADLELAGGASVDHSIDIRPGSNPYAAIALNIEYELEGEQQTAEWDVSGPVVSDTEQWDDASEQEWAATRDHDIENVDTDESQVHLKTKYF